MRIYKKRWKSIGDDPIDLGNEGARRFFCCF